MRRLLFIAIIIILLSACTGRRAYRSVLDRAEAVMNDRPDSALLLLDSISGLTADVPEGMRMKFLLLQMQGQNKCDTVFTSDSIPLLLTAYYDEHGTPNERMLAHYLLARAYSDMDDAPAALQSFHDAAECADTTSDDCDYATLNRVYGQMASLFYHQNMFDEQLYALRKAERYALKGGDTLTALLDVDIQALAYDIMDKKDSAMTINQKTYKAFKRLGRNDLAARTLFGILSLNIDRQNYQGLESSYKEYERNSGYFDKNGNIDRGRELYYHTKGSYFVGIAKYDSAEYYFRKCLANASEVESKYAGYHGLSCLYEKTHNKDSLIKYALLTSLYCDSNYLSRNTEDLQRMRAMYKYDRQKKVADEMRSMAEQERLKRITSLVSVVALLIVGGVIILYTKKEKDRKFREMTERYGNAISNLVQAKSDLKLLMEEKESNFVRLIEEKKEQIDSLQRKISEYNAKQKREDVTSLDEKLLSSDIYLVFLNYALKPIDVPTTKEWNELRKSFMEIIPNFHEELMVKHGITLTDYEMCMLMRLGFKPLDIANLMKCQKSTVSTRRQRLFFKMFGRKDTDKELSKYLKSIK
ncbi:hypothetical protein [Jeotgalibaca porci]|uniref:hypothetical protein n=1 Tax=Jeotgalibaca porci TaxID=1868793 RepID=UPI0035A1A5DF